MDEVFSGWGRTGKTFAYQNWDVKPDVVTFAKAIGGGVPLAGFMATNEMAASFEEGDHFTTFGSNNQIGMAAGHAVLDILKNENLLDNATKRGEQFLSGLKKIALTHQEIGDIRGIGLMIGIELVKDRHSREPYPDYAKKLQAELRKRQVLVSLTGVHGCIVRITPPLTITKEQIEHALSVINESLEALKNS